MRMWYNLRTPHPQWPKTGSRHKGGTQERLKWEMKVNMMGLNNHSKARLGRDDVPFMGEVGGIL